jgi:hypothetical protein
MSFSERIHVYWAFSVSLAIPFALGPRENVFVFVLHLTVPDPFRAAENLADTILTSQSNMGAKATKLGNQSRQLFFSLERAS